MQGAEPGADAAVCYRRRDEMSHTIFQGPMTVYVRGKPVGTATGTITIPTDAERAADPNTPPDVLNKLARHHYDAVEANIALPLIQLEDPRMHQNILWLCARGRMVDTENKLLLHCHVRVAEKIRARVVEKLRERILALGGIVNGNYDRHGLSSLLFDVMVGDGRETLQGAQRWTEYFREMQRVYEEVGAEFNARRRGKRAKR